MEKRRFEEEREGFVVVGLDVVKHYSKGAGGLCTLRTGAAACTWCGGLHLSLTFSQPVAYLLLWVEPDSVGLVRWVALSLRVTEGHIK